MTRYRLMYLIEIDAADAALAEKEAIEIMERDPLRLVKVQVQRLRDEEVSSRTNLERQGSLL